MRRVSCAHAWREWSPVVAYHQRLFAWMLLLTLLCQSVLPCGCARCGVGTASSAECSTSVCGGSRCSHAHGSAACDKTESVPRTGLSHERQSPGPAPCEAPCRRQAVFVSTNGTGNQASPSNVPDFGSAIASRQSTGHSIRSLSACIAIDFCPGGTSRMARSVRLQV